MLVRAPALDARAAEGLSDGRTRSDQHRRLQPNREPVAEVAGMGLEVSKVAQVVLERGDNSVERGALNAPTLLSSDAFDARDRFNAWREEIMLRVARVDVGVPDPKQFRTRLALFDCRTSLSSIALDALGREAHPRTGAGRRRCADGLVPVARELRVAQRRRGARRPGRSNPFVAA
jgi:hypothetical protein